MSDRLEALRTLKAAVEQDDPLKPRRIVLNANLIETALNDDDEHWSNFVGAYNGSVTDAIALAEAMLPGVYWDIRNYPISEKYSALLHGFGTTEAPIPARAMLLAVLDALIDREGEE